MRTAGVVVGIFYLMINIFWASTGKENGKLMS